MKDFENLKGFENLKSLKLRKDLENLKSLVKFIKFVIIRLILTFWNLEKFEKFGKFVRCSLLSENCDSFILFSTQHLSVTLAISKFFPQYGNKFSLIQTLVLSRNVRKHETSSHIFSLLGPKAS